MEAIATTIDSDPSARRRSGPTFISALMTTTPASLGRVEEIIDEYVRQGFHSIFLRSLSPYQVRGADEPRFADARSRTGSSFYKRGLAHILKINARGLSAARGVHVHPSSGSSSAPTGIATTSICNRPQASGSAPSSTTMMARSTRLMRVACWPRWATNRSGSATSTSDNYETMMTSESAARSVLEESMPEGAPYDQSDCAVPAVLRRRPGVSQG